MMYDTPMARLVNGLELAFTRLGLFDDILERLTQILWKLLMLCVAEKARNYKKVVESIHQSGQAGSDSVDETEDGEQASSKRSQHDEQGSVLQLPTKCEQIYCVNVCKFKVQPF